MVIKETTYVKKLTIEEWKNAAVCIKLKAIVNTEAALILID